MGTLTADWPGRPVQESETDGTPPAPAGPMVALIG